MTSAEPRQLAHRMHDAFNARDVDAADEIFAPDFFSHPLQNGRAAVKAAWTAMIAAHPEARTVVEDVLVDGDRVAMRSTVYGLSGGGDSDADPPPATLMEIFRVAEGRIAELWGATTMSALPPMIVGR
jgi:predicted SnoaL-like aldol condensation-catalyzing enzyme